MKYYALTNRWQKIIIIPMMKGLTLTHLSWEILSISFAGNEPIFSEDKAWLKIPLPLSEKAINHFQFKKIKNDNFEKTDALSKELSDLFASVMHISNFAEIVSNLNKVGEKVLEEYLAGFYVKLAGNIETANSIIVDLRASIDVDSINQQEVLQICEDAISPYGKPEDNQIIIHIGDCKEWALLLEKALSVLHLPIKKI